MGQIAWADRTSATLALDEDVANIRGISSARRSALKKLHIRTVRDLLRHFPRRYIDLTNITTICESSIGDVCTIQGTVCDLKVKRPRRNLTIIELAIQDDTGVLVVSIFNQIWLAKKYKIDDEIAVTGKVTFDYGFKRMSNPYIEITGGHAVEAKILPVHPASEKLSVATLRNIIHEALIATYGLRDAIPNEIRIKRALMSRGCAIASIHFPADMQEAKEARDSLAYEELLYLELNLMMQAEQRTDQGHPCAHSITGNHLETLRASIPFELTNDQKVAVRSLLDDMKAPSAANHMLLGDVGTGKTIVAAHGIAAATDTGGQSALLAPTEVLAMQHHDTLGPLFDAAGIEHALLTGSTSREDRSVILERLSRGEIDVLVGTHALLEDDVIFDNLTFAIIDEQQRFGVDQRAKLLDKGSAPDALYLTATPIPRTLALAIFGNLSLSYIKEKPNSNTVRTTRVLPRSERGIAYEQAGDALRRGEQVYVICPLVGTNAPEKEADGNIHENDEAYHPDVAIDDLFDYDDEDPIAARQEAQFLQQKVFPEYKVGLLHGSMPSNDKKEVMRSFSEGSIDVLVSTTVIEVGVDVKNATTMIVEDADRFGLSQLHQIRGRVGRGDKASQVFLISSSKKDEAIYRLRALEKSDDGFKLAEYDLALRREGDLLGNRQSGISTLKLVNIMQDAKLIEWAHQDARDILDSDPKLEQAQHRALRRELSIVFGSDASTFSG